MDVAALEAELQALRAEKEAAKLRINAFKQPFVPAPNALAEPERTSPRGDWGPSSARGDSLSRQGNFGRDGPRGDASQGRQQGSFDRGPRPSVFARMGSGSQHDDRSSGRMTRQDPPIPPVVSRKRIMSAVVVERPEDNAGTENAAPQQDEGEVVGGMIEQHEVQQRSEGGGGSIKRPAEAPVDDANLRKRNRRMFGSLLGTLQKFREEDQRFQATDTAQRRADIQRKAEERAKEESERLRKAAAELRAEQRNNEFGHLHDISLQTDIKMAEIMCARKIQNRTLLCNFLSTKALPIIYWKPGADSAVTDGLVEQQNQDLEQWKAEVCAELEAEKEGLKNRSLARQEQAAKRREEAIARRMNGGTSAPQGGAEDGMEEGEELEGAAGEYDGGMAVEHSKADDLSDPGMEDAGAEDEEDAVVKTTGRADANSVEDLLMD